MTIQEKISEKIKEQFFDLLPKEDLEELIKKEIDSFFSEKTKASFKVLSSNSWDNKDTNMEFSGDISPFRQMVWINIIQQTNETLKSKIISDYFNNQFYIEEGELNDKMKSIMKDAIPLAITQFFEKMSINLINQMEYMIRNNSNIV